MRFRAREGPSRNAGKRKRNRARALRHHIKASCTINILASAIRAFVNKPRHLISGPSTAVFEDRMSERGLVITHTQRVASEGYVRGTLFEYIDTSPAGIYIYIFTHVHYAHTNKCIHVCIICAKYIYIYIQTQT